MRSSLMENESNRDVFGGQLDIISFHYHLPPPPLLRVSSSYLSHFLLSVLTSLLKKDLYLKWIAFIT